MNNSKNFTDEDIGVGSGVVVPPSRPSLLTLNSVDYLKLRSECLRRFDEKLVELTPLVDELYELESGGVGLSDRHEVEDIIDCLARMRSAITALKGGE